MKRLTRTLGLLLFAWPFAGCDAILDSLTPDAVSVTGITLTSFPTTDGGASWDLTDDADLIFTITTQSSVLYEDNYYYEDVTSANLPLGMYMSNAYQLPTLAQTYYIRIWDHDDFSSHDFVGEATFVPNDHVNNQPTEIPFSSSTISGSVLVNWIFE